MLLKSSGSLCSGKCEGFTKHPPEIRVVGCREVAFEHCEAAPVPPIALLPLSQPVRPPGLSKVGS